MKTQLILSSAVALLLVSAASAADPKLHPLESFSAIYEQEGMMTGTYEEYCRNYCVERVEVEKFEMTMMGMKMPGEDRRLVSNGATKYTIDFAKGRVTEINNPFYADMAARATREGPVEAARQFLTMSGTVETSETSKVGSWDCTIWVNAAAGTRICMSKDMIPVQMQMNFAGMEFTRTLVELRIGDPGPDEMYEIPQGMEAKPLEMPAGAPANLKAIMDMLAPKQ